MFSFERLTTRLMRRLTRVMRGIFSLEWSQAWNRALESWRGYLHTLLSLVKQAGVILVRVLIGCLRFRGGRSCSLQIALARLLVCASPGRLP